MLVTLLVLPVSLFGASQSCKLILPFCALNAENQFDEAMDERTKVWMPTAEWDLVLAHRRALRMARVMTKDFTEAAPFVGMITEIKNPNQLAKLIYYLGVPYAQFMTSGRDVRGINTAIIVRADSPIGVPDWHQEVVTEDVPGRDGPYPTRNLLLVGWRKLGLYLAVVHGPSPGNVTEARSRVFSLLAHKLKEISRYHEINTPGLSPQFVMMGDWNVAPNVDVKRNPIQADLIANAPHPMLDVYESLSAELKRRLPNYTYYFRPRDKRNKDEGNMLDRAVVSASLFRRDSAPFRIVPESFAIGNFPFASVEYTTDSGEVILIPRAFARRDKQGDQLNGKFDIEFGYHDHWSIWVGLEAEVSEQARDLWVAAQQPPRLPSGPVLLDHQGRVWNPRDGFVSP